MPVLGTLGFDRVGDCVVYVGSDAAPVNEDWDRYIVFLASLRSTAGLDRALVLPGTGTPSPSQRRQLQEVTKNVDIRVAVVTASFAVRAVVTGLSWFAPGNKSFSPSELHAARVSWLLAHAIGLSAGHGSSVGARLGRATAAAFG